MTTFNYHEYTTPISAYQEISRGGGVVRYTDIDGNTIQLPEPCEVAIVDARPETPDWGVNGMEYISIIYVTRTEPVEITQVRSAPLQDANKSVDVAINDLSASSEEISYVDSNGRPFDISKAAAIIPVSKSVWA